MVYNEHQTKNSPFLQQLTLDYQYTAKSDGQIMVLFKSPKWCQSLVERLRAASEHLLYDTAA